MAKSSATTNGTTSTGTTSGTTATEGTQTAAVTDTTAGTQTGTDQGTQPAQTAGTTTATGAADKSFTQADIDAAIAKAQKDWDKKVKDAEAKAKLSEDERLKAEADELRGQLRERDARDTVRAEAEKLGVKNPAMVYRLVKDELEFDEKGKISNLKDVLAGAQSEFPELFSNKPQGSIDAGAGTTGDTPVLTKEKLAKMTPAEINALDWNAVQKVLTEK